MLEGLLNPTGPCGTVAFKFAENVPAILGESFDDTGEITFPILLAAPEEGLNKEELFKVEFASLWLIGRSSVHSLVWCARDSKSAEEN